MKSLKGLRFDNGPAKCVDIGTFDCSHHCSTEDCDFANKTITALGPGGGALIPGVHANQGGRPGMTYRASKVADASSAGGSTGQHGSPGALG